jgi:micrococcal nuclease
MTSNITAEEQKSVNDYLEKQFDNFFDKQLNAKYQYPALVVSVYDGDTITVNIDLGFGVELKKQKIRLYGINTPEVRGASKEQGIISRDYVRAKILHKMITLQSIKDKKGKYGRWLGMVLMGEEDVNLNKELITKDFAVFADY